MIAALVAAVTVVGCKGCSGSSPAQPAVVSGPVTLDNPVPDRTVLPLVPLVPSCDVDHRGAFLDMGTEMMLGRLGIDPTALPRPIEHDGATWAIIDKKRTDVAMTVVESTPVFAAARIEPKGAKSVAFYLDETFLGAERLAPGPARVVATPATELPIDAGAHTLSMRFTGNAKEPPLAHVDWIRLGVPDKIESTFVPPTLSTVVDDAALGRVPHRAISIKAPGAVRCAVSVPKHGLLRTSLGVFGGGNQEVEFYARTDGHDAVKLSTESLAGAESDGWRDVEVNLDAFAGQLIQLELRASKGSSSGRVLFGDPEVVVPTIEPDPVAEAQVVVIVVLSGVDRAELPPYATQTHSNFERLSQLSTDATVFMDHRSPTNHASGVMASLLTGLPPSQHTLSDPGGALPPGVDTIFTRAAESSVATALFTTVPQSFKPFGFSRGVQNWVEISPVSGEWKSPLTEAATWIDASLNARPTQKLLVVVHTRGGHPPWSTSGKQLDALPPNDYTGNITPRRAGEQLATIRKRRKNELPPNDYARVQALHELSLANEDRELGKLIDTIDAGVPDGRALVIVTSDLSSGMRTLFSDAPPLSEESLAVPLYILLPHRAHAGKTVSAPTEMTDIASTALASLGVRPLRSGLGQDLAQVASGLSPIAMRPSIAEGGERSIARWGTLTLAIRPRGEPFLCDVSLDPTCTFDRRAIMPLATDALLRGFAMAQRDFAKFTPPKEVTAEIDDATLAALKVTGAMD
ncbi:MAG: sulfatase-like hydrolase/transferase [Polyangiaceae bacterium]